MKVRNAGVLFIEKIKFGGKTVSRDIQMRCFISADYFHMHPSYAASKWEPRPEILFDSPLCEAWFHCIEQAAGKEPRFGGWGTVKSPHNRLGREKEPLVTSLATKYWRKKRN